MFQNKILEIYAELDSPNGEPLPIQILMKHLVLQDAVLKSKRFQITVSRDCSLAATSVGSNKRQFARVSLAVESSFLTQHNFSRLSVLLTQLLFHLSLNSAAFDSTGFQNTFCTRDTAASFQRPRWQRARLLSDSLCAVFGVFKEMSRFCC